MSPSTRRRRRWTLPALLLALVVALVATLWLASGLLLERWLERAGEAATGLETRLSSASCAPFRGELSLRGLALANPPGYPSEDFLELAGARATLRTGTLLSDVVVLPSVELRDLTLRLEEKDGRANVDVIREHAREDRGDEDDGGSDGRDEGFRIDELVARDVRVHATWAGEDVELRFDVLRLRDVGSTSKSRSVLGQIQGVVLTAVLDAVVRNAGELLPRALATSLGEAVSELGALGSYSLDAVDTVGHLVGGTLEHIPVPGAGPAAHLLEGTLEGATDVIEGAAEAAGEAVEEVVPGDGAASGSSGDERAEEPHEDGASGSGSDSGSSRSARAAREASTHAPRAVSVYSGACVARDRASP